MEPSAHILRSQTDKSTRPPQDRRRLLTDRAAFFRHVTESLHHPPPAGALFSPDTALLKAPAAVLFLIGSWRQCDQDGFRPCFIFNKRSSRVRQAGDLCFPGGRVMPRLDAWVAGGLRFPFSPLARWPYWHEWRRRPQAARRLSLLLAAGLRESLEEMRLNPFGIRFLGPLPLQRLQLLAREIYPMAVWIERQRRFVPNWEVEKIIPVPIDHFLKPDHYARCRIRFDFSSGKGNARATENFPCFRQPDAPETEVLWGATYRMVINFLEQVFDFRPPPMEALPLIRKTLGDEYVPNNKRP